MDFYIGQVFSGEYPPEAAEWCMNNNVLMKEITSEDDEQRKFVITEHSLDYFKEEKRFQINSLYNAAVKQLVSTYPNVELLTFDKQEKEARAWLEDQKAETPLVDMLAAGRQMEKSELIRRIIVKAEAFSLAAGYLTGQRQRYEDLLDAAESVNDVSAITPSYTYPEAKE